MAINTYSWLFLNGAARRGLVDSRATIKNMSSFTWMAWVKPDPGNGPYQRLYVERQGVGTGIRFAAAPIDGKLRFEFSPKDGVPDTNYDYNYTWDDNWHHIAFLANMTDSSSTYDIYLDATKVATGSLVVPSNVDLNGTTPIVSNTTPLGGSNFLGQASFHTSGGNVFVDGRYWYGNVDEMLLFSSNKTQGEIQTYFASDDTWDMTDVDMFSYFRFDEGSTNITTDLDNPTWTITASTSTIWDLDRPFLGNGVLDNVAPSVPGTPATQAGSITPDGFTATWTASTDAGPAGHSGVYVQYYELQVATVNDFSTVVTTINNGRDLSKHVNGLLPNQPYFWRVRAVDQDSNASAWAATQSLTTNPEGDVTAPEPPTNLQAPALQLSHTSFRVTWTASVSGDTDGYKLDVSTSPTFSSYITDFRNRDVGAVTQFDVYGLEPLTPYYVRLRAYDTSDNESINSSTLVVTTTSLPDTNPPLAVEMLPPTSVQSRAATLNWEEGIDDTHVTHYELDVAYDEAFTSFVTAHGVVYNDVIVGDVTSFRIDDLLPDTLYYYRVRAVDGGGNVSENTSPYSFTTDPSSVNEGGYITTRFSPTGDAWTNSASTAQNNGTATTLEVVGSGAATTRISFLKFDLSSVPGAFVSAMLRLYVTASSAAAISVQADGVSFTETTITWANQPNISGSILTFTPLNVNQWVEIDIASLLLDGATTYTIEIWTNSTDNAIFSSREGTNPPELILESDPSTATEVEPTVSLDDLNGTVVNYIKNPGAEVGTTANWLSVTSTITVTTADKVGGTQSFNVVCAGGTGQGIRYAINDIPAVVGENWGVALYLKSVSGGTSLIIRLSEYNSGGSLLASNSTTVTISTLYWNRFELARLITQATVAYVTVTVETPNASAATFRMDNVILTKLSQHPLSNIAYFDGDTDKAYWQGTAYASRSTLDNALVQMNSDYTGDGNLNNTAVPFFRRTSDVDWFYFPQLLVNQYTNNRGTKRITSYFGPTYGIQNFVYNPSFELDLTNWSHLNTGANSTLTRDVDFHATSVPYIENLASAKLVFTAGADVGIESNNIQYTAGAIVNGRMRIWAPTGVTVRLLMAYYTAAGAFVAASTPVSGTNEFAGVNDWIDIAFNDNSVNGTSAIVRLRAIVVAPSIGGTVWFDNAQVSKEGFAHISPYRDGSAPDAVWEGVPHASPTSIQLLNKADYVFKHRYADANGVLNATEDGYYHLSSGYTTAVQIDNPTTIVSLQCTTSNTAIDAEVVYEGDDNTNMTATISYKRADLANYASVPVSYDRATKTIHAQIPNLNPGTAYHVRLIVTDSDGVYGGTGVLTNTITHTETTTTDYDSPDVSSSITFGGFLLMGREDGFIGVEEHDAFGLPDRRVQIEDLPRLDGAIELQNLWGRRKINMKGFVTGESRGELEDNKNALKRALAPKQQRLVIDTLSNDRRYYIATCESLAIAEQGGENIRHLTWDAEFVCADPFAYDTDLTLLPEFIANSTNTVAITNEGDIRVDPIIKIRTTNSKSVTVTIYNQTTGERITPDTTILNNDRLVLDTSKFSVLKNGVEVDYAGGFIHLAPGANVIQFFLSSVLATPSIRCEMSWRHKYL